MCRGIEIEIEQEPKLSRGDREKHWEKEIAKQNENGRVNHGLGWNNREGVRKSEMKWASARTGQGGAGQARRGEGS